MVVNSSPPVTDLAKPTKPSEQPLEGGVLKEELIVEKTVQRDINTG